MNDMSGEPKKRSRAWIWWTLFAAFVLYPLSIGPVAWVAHGEAPIWLMYAYAPVLCAAEASGPAVAKALKQYMQLRLDVEPEVPQTPHPTRQSAPD
jgi:hypothetical protein